MPAHPMIVTLLLLLVGACGARSQSTSSERTEPAPAVTPEESSTPAVTPEESSTAPRATAKSEAASQTSELRGDALLGALCDRVKKLQCIPIAPDMKCKMPIVPHEAKSLLTAWMQCSAVADSCVSLNHCNSDFDRAVAARPRKCGEPGIGPVAITAEKAKMRYGSGFHRLATAYISQSRPVEVCGTRAQYEWLRESKCANGRSPVASMKDFREASRGLVDVQGQCSSKIDRFMVSCPEKQYNVFLDGSMCGPDDNYAAVLPFE
ncbi:MAG: hypothetical protein JKY56_14795 [Kofleriaceae bacterium]|nr:hypothetical protein [Kofleriaceae bacterium]